MALCPVMTRSHGLVETAPSFTRPAKALMHEGKNEWNTAIFVARAFWRHLLADGTLRPLPKAKPKTTEKANARAQASAAERAER